MAGGRVQVPTTDLSGNRLSPSRCAASSSKSGELERWHLRPTLIYKKTVWDTAVLCKVQFVRSLSIYFNMTLPPRQANINVRIKFRSISCEYTGANFSFLLQKEVPTHPPTTPCSELTRAEVNSFYGTQYFSTEFSCSLHVLQQPRTYSREKRQVLDGLLTGYSRHRIHTERKMDCAS